MKTRHLLLAMATLTTAGCSQNDITEMNPDANTAIGFEVYTGVQTRGLVTDYNAIKATGVGFGVMALKGSSPALYMADTNVKYDATAPAGWKYSPAIYWPNDGEAVSFYAFAPYNGAGIDKGTSSADFQSTSAPSVTFSLQTPKKMVDLVAAKAESKTSSGGTISLSFKHVLSRLALKAHTSDVVATGTEVKITGLKIKGSSNNSGSLFYNTAKYDIKSDSWTLSDGDKQSNDWTIIDGTVSDENVYGAATVTGTAASILGADTQYLFFVPVGTTEVASAIQMELTYTITSNGVTTTTTKTVSIATGTDKFLQKGTAYVIDFEIALNTISFTLDEVSGVDGWGSDSSVTLS